MARSQTAVLVLAIALVAANGACNESASCRPDTARLVLRCSVDSPSVDKVSVWLWEDALNHAPDRSYEVPLSCPGEASLELKITDYAAGRALAPTVRVSASGKLGRPIAFPPITLTPGCSTATLTLDSNHFSIAGSAQRRGDLNGDGVPDIVVGAPAADDWKGTAYVYLGDVGVSGLSSSPSATLVSPIGRRAGFGSAIAGADDLDGDGHADLVVGASGTDDGKGAVYVYLGSRPAPGFNKALSTPLLTLTPPADSPRGFGASVATADINGDGKADVIVGAADAPNAAGAVFVYLSTATSNAVPGSMASPTFTLKGPGGDPYFASNVANAGDFNGDGYADIIVGARAEAGAAGAPFGKQGKVYLYLGSGDTGELEGSLSAPALTLLGPSDHDDGLFAATVTGVGDLNGDGFDDVAVGTYFVDANFGKAYVFLGQPAVAGAVASREVSPSFTLVNPTRGDTCCFGSALAGAGDINGDGNDDLIISAPSSKRSEVHVYLGSGTTEGLTTSFSRPAFTLTSGSGEASFGASVGKAGDLNADGNADFVVGASDTGGGAGSAFLFLGSSTPEGLAASLSTPHAVAPARPGGYFGGVVASAGDLDGDGHPDLVIGAPGFEDRGQVSVYGGRGDTDAFVASRPALLMTVDEPASWRAQFGDSMADVGDINGDGYGDLLIGAPYAHSNAGRAYVYLGTPSGLGSARPVPSFSLTDPAPGMSGTNSLDSGTLLNAGAACPACTPRGTFGSAVAGLGDINGDGYADFIVSSPYGGDGSGVAYVYLGTPTTLAIASPSLTLRAAAGTASSFGMAVAGAGDINGDGFDDFIIGADGPNNGAGRAYVYLGSASAAALAALQSIPSFTLDCPEGAKCAGAGFGDSVAGAGDVNGDGNADLIVGAPTIDDLTGKAYVYLGSGDRATLAASLASPALTLSGRLPYGEFGIRVASAGDLDGDGNDDVVVGAYMAGEAYVYLGSGSFTGLVQPDSAPWFTVAVAGGPAGFGSSVARAGDVDGDGHDDLLIGGVNPMDGGAGSAYVFRGSNSTARLANSLASPWLILASPAEPAGPGGPYDWFGYSLAACR